MKKYLILGAVSMALAACSGGDADSDGDGKISREEMKKEASNVKMTPGEWENTVEIVDVAFTNAPEGMPKGMMDALKGQKNTDKHCLTQEEADNPGGSFFASQDEENCDVKRFDMSGGKIDSEMTCKNGGQGEMTMTMSGSYDDDSYDMTMKMSGEQGGMNMTMQAKSTGKRIGDCPS